MGSGTSKTASGAATMDASELIEIRGLGFKPTRVELFGEDMDTAIWHEPMPALTYFNRVPAGDGTWVTTAGITPQQDGFDIAIGMVNFNVDGELVYWHAWE